MESNLKTGVAVAAFDAEIQQIIKDEDFDGGGQDFRIGIRNEAGAIYRDIITTGMGELIGTTNALSEAGFTDELEELSTMRDGYDAIFSR